MLGIYIYMHTYIQTYMHTHIPTYTYIHTYICITYMHACLHPNILHRLQMFWFKIGQVEILRILNAQMHNSLLCFSFKPSFSLSFVFFFIIFNSLHFPSHSISPFHLFSFRLFFFSSSLIPNIFCIL